MRVPTKYSELNTKQRGVLGYLIVTIPILTVGHMYQPLMTATTVVMGIACIFLCLGKYVSPYYLSWSAGASMMPSIPLGMTMIVVSTRNLDQVGVGDVVSYESENGDMLVHHRIVRENEDGYVLKGDGNEEVDPENVSLDQIRHRTIEYGYQPIYIPASPFAIVATILKFRKKVKGKHKDLMQDHIETEQSTPP